MTMPTTTSSLQGLTQRLPALVTQPQALARRAASQWSAPSTERDLRPRPRVTRWRALPATTRWQAAAAALIGLLLLAMYVLTLQSAVERGEALREQRRLQGITSFGAGTPPARLQTVSTGSTRS